MQNSQLWWHSDHVCPSCLVCYLLVNIHLNSGFGVLCNAQCKSLTLLAQPFPKLFTTLSALIPLMTCGVSRCYFPHFTERWGRSPQIRKPAQGSGASQLLPRLVRSHSTGLSSVTSQVIYPSSENSGWAFCISPHRQMCINIIQMVLWNKSRSMDQIEFKVTFCKT